MSVRYVDRPLRTEDTADDVEFQEPQLVIDTEFQGRMMNEDGGNYSKLLRKILTESGLIKRLDVL